MFIKLFEKNWPNEQNLKERIFLGIVFFFFFGVCVCVYVIWEVGDLGPHSSIVGGGNAP